MKRIDDIVVELADFIKEYCTEQDEDCLGCTFKTQTDCKLFNSTPNKWTLKPEHKKYVPKEEKEVREAAKIIKKYCFEKGEECYNCAFKNKGCSFKNDCPERWDIKE